jgi:putative hydrolase of the HAD superfamily
MSAVVFDLWQTLVAWPGEESERLRRSWASGFGVSLERLDEHWYGNPDAYRVRETGPLAPALFALCDALGGSVSAEKLFADRLELTRRALVASSDIERTLREVRARGYRIGLVSNCTEDVALSWPESPLAPLVDRAVFSATAGCMKPEPHIYELVCEALSVDPADCLFVGDGASDELRGAAAVGMTPVLLAVDGVPRWDTLADWPGRRIERIPDILDFL